ncbi:hypothetical protein [Streptomyces sp. CB01881]|uniref:hypothetical protein n=1 Tax=Streptomyces sp. CB01881 TaxID=2078691 RepID=UPI00129C3D99|nr:hypothetical protein [Streptomyces sp. CB01881]
MIHRICPWWLLHCSRAPVARLLRAERRRLEAELALILPAASARIRERVLASLASQPPH